MKLGVTKAIAIGTHNLQNIIALKQRSLSEFVGLVLTPIGLIPYLNAQSWVPSHFIIYSSNFVQC